MIRLQISILFLLLGSLLYGQDTIKPTWSVKWDQGVRIDRSDGEFKFKIGGRVQYDVMSIWQNEELDEEFDALNGSEFRRIRWATSGTLYGNVKFKLQFDFARGDAGVKDAYVEIVKIPWIGNFRAGHFKQPFGFEMQTSSNHVVFMERGLTNAFTPERDIGFMIHNRVVKKRIGWYAGFFFPTGNVGKYLGNQRRITLRLAGLPLFKKEGTYTVIHLGAAVAHQFHDGQEFSLSERPEAHLAPKYANLIVDAASTANVVGGELAIIRGPFSLQTEAMYTTVVPTESSSSLHDRYNYYAFYAHVSWMITGEHRNYSTSKNSFNIIKPKKNLGKSKGAGAWEIAIRFSHLDLNDRDKSGGGMNDFTAGINWYLNPATKFRFNYVYSDVFNSGFAHIAQMRFQVVF